MQLSDATPERIFSTYERLGYKTFNAPYELNIFGIRDPNNVDSFNDVIGVFHYDEDQKLTFHKYIGTTDPGLKMLRAPMNSKGCAVLVEGQWVDCFKKGYHHGKYKCYVQNKNVAVYRDNNKDGKLDFDRGVNGAMLDIGDFGIHIHHANENMKSVQVGGWSAGCQVIDVFSDWKEFISFQDMAIKHGYTTFTYTLLTLKQYKD